jgi:integrase
MITKLTKRSVEGIAPGQKPIYAFDADVKNFGLRVLPSGVRSYFVQYWAEGRRRRYTIGQHGPITAEQARQQALALLGEVAKGGNPADIRTEDRLAISLNDLADRYLEDYAKGRKKPRSIKEDQRLLRDVILPVLGKRKVVEVSRAEVAKFHHGLKRTPYQANRALALLSKMFNLAERWGLRPDVSNPCRHVEKFKEQKRERFLSGDELARMGAALVEAERSGSALYSVITALRLLMFTGCRLSEILTLKWEYVDFEHGCLRLPESKTGAKVVPLGALALELLAKTKPLAGNPYVCPGVKPGCHLVGLPHAWGRLQKRAGLEGIRLHDLRHSFASVGAAAGLGLPIIGALLGHTQMATTQRYAHLANDPLRAAADEITRRLAEAMGQDVD